MEVTLEIPRAPPSYSQIIRMKVKDRIQMKKLWRLEVMAAVMDLTGPHHMVGSLTNFKKGFKIVNILQHRKTLIRDPDNLWASVKPILDALKHNGLIIDDDFKHIDLSSVLQCRVTGDSLIKTVITISDPEVKE